MRVIFLDIDGELTYAGYSNEETHNIDSEKVALLKEIVDAVSYTHLTLPTSDLV